MKKNSKKEKEGILLIAVAKQACICMNEMSREAHNKLNISYDTSVLKFPSLPSDIESKPAHPRNQMSEDHAASPLHHPNVRRRASFPFSSRSYKHVHYLNGRRF